MEYTELKQLIAFIITLISLVIDYDTVNIFLYAIHADCLL